MTVDGQLPSLALGESMVAALKVQAEEACNVCDRHGCAACDGIGYVYSTSYEANDLDASSGALTDSASVTWGF